MGLTQVTQTNAVHAARLEGTSLAGFQLRMRRARALDDEIAGLTAQMQDLQLDRAMYQQAIMDFIKVVLTGTVDPAWLAEDFSATPDGVIVFTEHDEKKENGDDSTESS